MRKVGCLILTTAAFVLLAAVPADAGGGKHRSHHRGFNQHQRFQHKGRFHQPRVFHHHRQFRHHHHSGAKFVFGFGPVWWGPAYRVYRAPVVIQQSPPVYIQQEPYYWYYCTSAQAYYPYVQQCPGGWLKVVPPQTDPAPQ